MVVKAEAYGSAAEGRIGGRMIRFDRESPPRGYPSNPNQSIVRRLESAALASGARGRASHFGRYLEDASHGHPA